MLEHPLIRYALYGGGIYLLLNVYAALISDRLIFQPMIPGYDLLPDEVRIPVSCQETLNAVWLKNPEAKYTLLFNHGNGEDLSRVYPFIQQFKDRGYSVLMYDYRGYGTSDGKASYAHAKADADAVFRWLTEEQDIAPETIIAQGRSLGGALAIHLAAQHKIAGLICECSFVSAFRVKTGVPLLPWDKFKNEKLIKNVQCPSLIIHGKNDSVVPFWHGRKLYEAAPEPKRNLWIEGAEHMDYAYVAEEQYFETIDAFVKELVSP